MGFYGDLLKILAHTGLQTGGNILSQSILQPMVESAKTRSTATDALIKAYTPGLSTGSEKDQEAIATFMEEASGRKLPRTSIPVTNTAGTEIISPTGAALTAPTTMNLKDLAPGYNEVTKMGLVRPPVQKLEELSSGLMTRGLSGGPEDVGFGANLLGRIKSMNSKVTDMQRYVEAVKTGDEQTVGAIEKFYGGRNAVRAMFGEFQKNPEAVKGFYDTSKPSDLTRTRDMTPGVAASTGANATLMQPQVSVIDPNKPLPATATKGSIVGPTDVKKGPSVQEQISTIDKEIDSLSKDLAEGTYKRPEAKTLLESRIGERKAQRDALATQQPTPAYQLPKGGKMVPVTKEQYDAYVAKYGAPK
jgi:hypothetical protein